MGRRLDRGWLVGLVASGLVLAGCASSGGSGEEPAGDSESSAEVFGNGLVGVSEPEGEPTSGGTLTFATYSEARSLDPAVTVNTGSSGGIEMAAVYDVLLRYDPESGEYEPRLAESFEPDTDYTTWTLELPEGVTFSDGTPLDADAVVASIERYVAQGGGQAYVWQSNVASATATGDRTVTFELTRSWPGFGYLLATGPGMIVAPAADEGKEFTPVGAGPFVAESYAPGEDRVLTARADYWDGEPRLDRLRFVPISGGQPRLDLLDSGGADLGYFRDADAVTDARGAGYGGFMEVDSVGDALMLNHREGAATSDVRVRKAVSLAIDVETVDERVNAGEGIPEAGLFPGVSQWSLETEPLGHDVEKAKALLQEAKADGYDGTISFSGVAQVSEKMGVTLQALLERVGFEVELDYAASVTDLVGQVASQQDFEMAIWGFGTPDGGVYAELYGDFHSDSPANLGGYADPEMDTLLEQLGAAPDEAGRKRALEQIQRRWSESVPAVTMAASPEFVAWNEDVHGVVPTVDSVVLLDEAWTG